MSMPDDLRIPPGGIVLSMEQGTKTLVYTVPDIHCAHCQHAITSEVSQLAGVASVDVDLDTKLVTVLGAGVSDRAVRDAIFEAGYEAD